MKINTLRKKVSKILDDMSELIEKLENLGDEFDDDEFTSILGAAVEDLSDAVVGDNNNVGEMLSFLENYEEYKEEDYDE